MQGWEPGTTARRAGGRRKPERVFTNLYLLKAQRARVPTRRKRTRSDISQSLPGVTFRHSAPQWRSSSSLLSEPFPSESSPRRGLPVNASGPLHEQNAPRRSRPDRRWSSSSGSCV